MFLEVVLDILGLLLEHFLRVLSPAFRRLFAALRWRFAA